MLACSSNSSSMTVSSPRQGHQVHGRGFVSAVAHACVFLPGTSPHIVVSQPRSPPSVGGEDQAAVALPATAMLCTAIQLVDGHVVEEPWVCDSKISV